MSQSEVLEELRSCKLKILSDIKSNFSKVQKNKFNDLKSYFFEMDKIARGYKLRVVTSNVMKRPFNYLELKTSKNQYLKFCEEIFTKVPKDIKLGNDLLYANTYIGYIICSNIQELSEKLNNELKNEKLINIRWQHYSNNTRNVINLKMPRGELYYFKNKAQHLQKYSKEWIQMLIKPPVLYYCIGNKRYSIPRDETTLNASGLKIPIHVKKQKMYSCFKGFLLLSMSKKIMADLEASATLEGCYWDSLYSDSEEEFWYFQNRCSITWAAGCSKTKV